MSRFLTVLRAAPKTRRWLDQTIQQHRPASMPIDAGRFPRLAESVSAQTLNAAKVVVVKTMPRPPLEEWHLHAIDDFTFFNAAGLTLDDLIFVRKGHEFDESLVFHELVHVIQWRILGRGRFLALYGMSLLQDGYDQNPLEIMAYDLQARFDADALNVEFEPVIERRVQEFVAKFRRRSIPNRLVELLGRLLT